MCLSNGSEWVPSEWESDKNITIIHSPSVKGTVHPKNLILSSFTHPSSISKPVWMCLFCWTQMKIFWRMWKQSIIFLSYYGSQWCPKTAWSQTCLMLQNVSVSNKCCSFELYIHLWILKNKLYAGLHKNVFSTLIIIRNVSWAAYYYDFWRSCDTEDWSNDAGNTALITEINYTLTDIHTENSCFKL